MQTLKKPTRIFSFVLLILFSVTAFSLSKVSRAQAACPVATGQYGSVSYSTVTVPASGTYRLWVRINSPDTTNNSVSVDISNGNNNFCNINVGDSSSVPVNTWKWIDYKNGSATTKNDLALDISGAGNNVYQVSISGREPNVAVDKFLLVSDTTCVPQTIDGSDCLADSTAPTVSLTAPTITTSVTGTTTISANASDARGISKVEFYAGAVLLNTDTTSPFSYGWDTSNSVNATYQVTAKAYDNSGNSATTSPVSLVISNPPTVSVTSPVAGTVSGTVQITSSAASVTGISKVEFYQGTTLVGVSLSSPFTVSFDSTKIPDGAYTLSAKAFDTVGISSSSSVSVNVVNKVVSVIPPLTIKIFEDTFSKDGSYVDQNLDSINRIRLSNISGCGTGGNKCATQYNRKGFLKFKVSGMKAAPKTITLRLNISDSSTDGGKIYKIESNSWSQTTLTWNNSPSFSSNPLGTVGPINSGKYVDVVLSPSAITADGTYSFGMSNSASDMAGYYSGETNNGPTLTFTF